MSAAALRVFLCLRHAGRGGWACAGAAAVRDAYVRVGRAEAAAAMCSATRRGAARATFAAPPAHPASIPGAGTPRVWAPRQAILQMDKLRHGALRHHHHGVPFPSALPSLSRGGT